MNHPASFFAIALWAAFPGTMAPLSATAEPPRPAGPAIVAKLAAAFARLDEDGDGRIRHGEWNKLGPGKRRPRHFRPADRNRDGRLSFVEFARALGRRLPPGTTAPVDRARRSFHRLDQDGNGLLSREELAAFPGYADATLDEWFEGLDVDGSGGVDLGEWRQPQARPLPDYSRYVGLTHAAAAALAASENRHHRVVSIDGAPQMVTMDYSPERVNFALVGGFVTQATGG